MNDEERNDIDTRLLDYWLAGQEESLIDWDEYERIWEWDGEPD